jgi:predicted  nucleic acid-binding Zn-ribbon protein
MKIIKIEDKQVLKYLQDKDELVKNGRRISDEISRLETKITDCENKEKKITEKRQPKELGEKAEALKVEINKLVKEFEKVCSAITVDKLSAIPKELEKTHKDLMKLKEAKEQERNKLALKVQKIKDRVVPKIKKHVAPQLEEYEDIQTAEIKKGEVVVTVYSALDEWKEAYKKKNMV